MQTALQVIRTWADFERDHPEPEIVRLNRKALRMEATRKLENNETT
jgi:hypothetical protein